MQDLMNSIQSKNGAVRFAKSIKWLIKKTGKQEKCLPTKIDT